MNKISFIWFFIVLILFVPFIYILYKWIYNFNFHQVAEIFFSEFMLNTVLIAFFSSVLSIFFGFFLSLFFISSRKKNILIMLMILLFGVSKYTFYFFLDKFIHNEYVLSVVVETLHYLPLSILFFLLIKEKIFQTYLLNYINFFNVLRFYKFVVIPQTFKIILMFFFFLFLMIFSSQEISSLLGIENVSQFIISSVMMQDDITKIFSVISFELILIIFFALLVRKVVNFQILESIDKENGLFDFKNKEKLEKTVIFLFTVFFIILFITLFQNIKCKELMISDDIVILFKSLFFYSFISVCTILVAEIIFLFRNKGKFFKEIIALFIIIFSLLPSSIVAFSFLEVFTGVIENYYLLLIISEVYVLLPFVLFIFLIFKKDEDIILGTNFDKVNYFFKIYLYKYKKLWFFAFVFTLFFAMNILSIPILLSPPGFEVYIVKVFNLLHYGDKSNVAFLEILQLMIFGILIFVLLRKAIYDNT